MTIPQVKTLVTKYLKDERMLGTMYVTVSSLVTGFFAYLLQIYLGRKLTIADYGAFNTLLSIHAMLTVLNAGFAVSIIKVVSELYGKEDNVALTKLFWTLFKGFIFVGLVVMLGLVLFRGTIIEVFHIDNRNFIIFFSIFIFAFYTISVPAAFLQGTLKFKELSVITTIQGFLRLGLGFLMAYLGFRVGGIFFAFAFVMFVTSFLSTWVIKDIFKKNGKVDLRPHIKKVFTFSVPVFLVYFGMMFFFNIDIILVKSFFDPRTAGIYVGVSTIGKIILYGTNMISVVMFPQISSVKARGGNYHSSFKKFTAIQLAFGIAAVLPFLMFPQQITLSLFGDKFTESISYVPIYAVFISLYSLVNFIVKYFLATDKNKVSLLIIPAAILQIVLIVLYHDNLDQILYINTGVMFMLLLFLGFQYLRPSKFMT